jgi:hypothetical protein
MTYAEIMAQHGHQMVDFDCYGRGTFRYRARLGGGRLLEASLRASDHRQPERLLESEMVLKTLDPDIIAIWSADNLQEIMVRKAGS